MAKKNTGTKSDTRRVDEIARVLEGGLTICEWQRGGFTDWQYDHVNRATLRQPDGAVGFALAHRDEPSASHMADRLGAHNNPVSVYCPHCGESLLDLSPDGENPDYVCDRCRDRMITPHFDEE